MEVKTTLDQWDPFNFRIEGAFGFKFHIEGLIREGLLETALERINLIRKKYYDAKEFDLIKQDNFRHTHFNKYRTEQTELVSLGKTYPDGSTDKVIFELNELERLIKSLNLPKVKKGTVPFVALYLYYSGADVDYKNVDEIARQHGFENGRKLIQEYNKFRSYTDRTADPESKTKLKHKIELFENVINDLDNSQRGKIEDELKILKGHLLKY